MTRTILTLLLVAAASGCVLPPVRASAGGGAGGGDVILRNSSNELRQYNRTMNGEVRLGFTPLTLGKTFVRRGGDLSLGWSLDWQTAWRERHDFMHGPYIEGVWFKKREAPDERKEWRVGPTASIDLRMSSHEYGDTIGFGATVGGLLELADDVTGPIFFGGAQGELAIGLSARAGVRRVDDGTYAYAVISVEVRTPGMAAWLTIPQQRPR